MKIKNEKNELFYFLNLVKEFLIYFIMTQTDK